MMFTQTTDSSVTTHQSDPANRARLRWRSRRGLLENDLILTRGDLAGGAALSFVLLVASGLVAAVAYRLSRISRLES